MPLGNDSQPPDSGMSDLPPPGAERRRLLRASGLSIRLSDFTAKERQERWDIDDVQE